ncbi:hypothetical protein PHYSODRAFT_338593 [Phytophthora sojae]|uniref:U-box domain-containing protein n=1 Tax=Phytophthora sojae (strain P6497) TaxID=1094619 RepID=G5A2I8_PHYSP|nr:hypothetical protein PHYSODRAFT_338593 [Phytophthora sojae]EGZ09879.1 hypothetical protein PHYSODRAFT_338593 [Phytophthora sojae]|eukprot:XP_009534740.1 hypothetical protein PHYSODRAFT_338593 [Phytophthora sojae]
MAITKLDVNLLEPLLEFQIEFATHGLPSSDADLPFLQQLQEQIDKLQEENGDLEDALEQQREDFASKRKRFWEEMEELQDEYRRHCQQAERVQGRLRDERKAERQRADELQRLVNSSAEQLQAAAELQAQIESLQQQIRNQQTAAETERLELERRASADKLRLETKVQELKKQLQEQSTQFQQERAHLLQQGARRDNSRDDIHSSLVNAMPHMQRLMEALERGNGRAESPAEPIDLTEDQELANRLNEQRSAFDRERAQLVEQASDAAKTQQDISRRSHAEREAVLTCPISLDLFEDPVWLTTSCIGRSAQLSDSPLLFLSQLHQLPRLVLTKRRVPLLRHLKAALTGEEAQKPLALVKVATGQSARKEFMHAQKFHGVDLQEFKDSDVKQLQERICEEEVEREAERQRADRLQRIVTSSTEQVEALKAHIQSLQQVTRTQRLDAAQERAQSLQQGARRDNDHDDIHSSLVNAMPHMQRLMEALERGNGRAESPAEPIDLTEDQELANRLNEQRSAFDRERAQLVEQASDAAKTQQDISRRSHAEREAVLTCPISLDLFEDPVVTE